jgi:hypothetical protein
MDYLDSLSTTSAAFEPDKFCARKMLVCYELARINEDKIQSFRSTFSVMLKVLSKIHIKVFLR